MRLPCPPALYEPGSAGQPRPIATLARRAPPTGVQTPDGEVGRFGRAPPAFALSPPAVGPEHCISEHATVLRPAEPRWPPEQATGGLPCGPAVTREPPFFARGASCAGMRSAFAGPGAGAGAGPASDPAHRGKWRRQSGALRRGPRWRDPRSHTVRATRGWRSCVPVAD
jgi:hypothetical protein